LPVTGVLKPPIIYNTNGYDVLATLKLLDGVVDVYLPDLKYADSAKAKAISHINVYPKFPRQVVLEMYRQVGPWSLRDDGLAGSGILVRHLLLPEGLAGTWEKLCFIALELSPSLPLDREITPKEYGSPIPMA
jgi:putative pyruvate formate lyase activating enzyme